jgi:hypothetical protein
LHPGENIGNCRAIRYRSEEQVDAAAAWQPDIKIGGVGTESDLQPPEKEPVDEPSSATAICAPGLRVDAPVTAISVIRTVFWFASAFECRKVKIGKILFKRVWSCRLRIWVWPTGPCLKPVSWAISMRTLRRKGHPVPDIVERNGRKILPECTRFNRSSVAANAVRAMFLFLPVEILSSKYAKIHLGAF